MIWAHGSLADDVKSAQDAERKALNEFSKAVRETKAHKPEEYEALRKKHLDPAQKRTNDAVFQRMLDDQKEFADKMKAREEEAKRAHELRMSKMRREAEARLGRPLKKGKGGAKDAIIAITGPKAPTGRVVTPGPAKTSAPRKEEVVLDGSKVPKELEFRKKKRGKGAPSPSPEPDEKIPTDGEILNAVGGGKAVDEVQFQDGAKKKSKPKP
jgi:hypothetical protein